MRTDVSVGGMPRRGSEWYAKPPAAVAQALAADPVRGLSASVAADRLRAYGPNALPEEKPKPGWLRFLEGYRSYMQIILLAAAIVSLVVQEWGKAESAMNARSRRRRCYGSTSSSTPPSPSTAKPRG